MSSISEAITALTEEVASAYEAARRDKHFLDELNRLQRHYNGRPTPMYEAAALRAHAGGARIFLKREDLNHTGSHKINNAFGQCLLARRMGKLRVVAGTGPGQHGVATAAACALLGLECVIYMGASDAARQASNVAQMRMFGAKVVSLSTGSSTLKEASIRSMADWANNAANTFYCLGAAAGPEPFPVMVRDFQRVIGTEARTQLQQQAGRLPDVVAACVGGGSNAIGIFDAFIDDPDVRLVGFEIANDAAPQRMSSTYSHAYAALHSSVPDKLRCEDQQTAETGSIPTALTFPRLGPDHSALKASGRATYRSIDNADAMHALLLLARAEGIIPAIESAHALAGALSLGSELDADADSIILINISGRGDKDVEAAAKWFELTDGNTTDAAGPPHRKGHPA